MYFCLLISIIMLQTSSIVSNTMMVQRYIACDYPETTYYSSYDIFTNTKNATSFCVSRNASCIEDCRSCRCIKDFVFTSYEHGCLKFNDARKIWNSSPCFTYAKYIPSICSYVLKPADFNESITNCTINSSYRVNIFTGKRERIPDTFNFYNKYYVQCKTGKYTMNDFSGQLIYLDVTCKKLSSSTDTVDTCYMFNVNGSFYSNETHVLSNNPDRLEFFGSRSSVFFLIIMLTAGLVIIVTGIIIFKRKQKCEKKNLQQTGFEHADNNTEIFMNKTQKENNMETDESEYTKIKLSDVSTGDYTDLNIFHRGVKPINKRNKRDIKKEVEMKYAALDLKKISPSEYASLTKAGIKPDSVQPIYSNVSSKNMLSQDYEIMPFDLYVDI